MSLGEPHCPNCGYAFGQPYAHPAIGNYRLAFRVKRQDHLEDAITEAKQAYDATQDFSQRSLALAIMHIAEAIQNDVQ